MSRRQMNRNLVDGVRPIEDFGPVVSYEADGDTIEVVWDPSAFIGDPVLPGLVLYRKRDGGEVVGVLIDGVAMVKRRGLTTIPGRHP